MKLVETFLRWNCTSETAHILNSNKELVATTLNVVIHSLPILSFLFDGLTARLGHSLLAIFSFCCMYRHNLRGGLSDRAIMWPVTQLWAKYLNKIKVKLDISQRQCCNKKWKKAYILKKTLVWAYNCCVFWPANARLRMRLHGRKRWKTFKNHEKSTFFILRTRGSWRKTKQNSKWAASF